MSFVVLSIIFVFQKSFFNDGKLHVVFCDVGQGDAIFIRTPGGSDILVDAGPDDSVLSCLESHMPFWDRELELIFATHPDADHITGFKSVLKNYTVKAFNTSKKSKETKVFARIQELVQQKKTPFRYLFSGDSYSVSDGVLIKTFWPTQEYVDSDTTGKLDSNSFSLVQTVSYRSFNVLLTGDIEAEILNNLFDPEVSVDVFKLPHHGSKTGVDEKTFEIVKQSLSIISAGRNNRYHHPAPQVLQLLKRFESAYKDTLEGDIEIVSDGKEWWVK